MEHEEAQSHANQQNIPNNSSAIHFVSDEDTRYARSLNNENSLSDE